MTGFSFLDVVAIYDELSILEDIERENFVDWSLAINTLRLPLFVEAHVAKSHSFSAKLKDAGFLPRSPK